MLELQKSSKQEPDIIHPLHSKHKPKVYSGYRSIYIILVAASSRLPNTSHQPNRTTWTISRISLYQPLLAHRHQTFPSLQRARKKKRLVKHSRLKFLQHYDNLHIHSPRAKGVYNYTKTNAPALESMDSPSPP